MGSAVRSPKDPTVAEYGYALGLSEQQIIDALCEALEIAGPGVGGRFIGPGHPVTNDEPCKVAIDVLRAMATRSGTFPLE